MKRCFSLYFGKEKIFMRRMAIHRIRESRNKPARRIRESKIPTADGRALREVQNQFDALAAQMPDAKILLAGLATGGDDARTNTKSLKHRLQSLRRSRLSRRGCSRFP
jgi:hypothetical protein